MKHQYLSAVAAAALLVSAGQAQAQMEEVVVTARKTAERLQDVPVTVTALTSEAVERLQLKNIYDVVTVTPGLYFGTTGGRNGGNKLQIRNLSTGTSGGSKASAFIDGVYMGEDYESTPLANLERIEVLKGPQSVTYGRSTFVGAVNFITKDPATDAMHAKLDLSAASYNDIDFNGYVSAPLGSDKVADMVTFRYYDFRGPSSWANSDGYHLGSQRTKAVSNKLVFTPSDDLKIKIYSSYLQDADAIPPVLFADLTTRNLTVARPDGTFGYYWSGPVNFNYNYPSWNEKINGYIVNPGIYRDQLRNVGSFEWTLGGQNVTGFVSYGREMVKSNFDFNYLGAGSIVLPNAKNVPTLTTYGGPFSNIAYGRQLTHDAQAELRVSAPTNWKFRYTAGVNWTKLTGATSFTFAGISPTLVQSPPILASSTSNWIGGNPARDISVFGGLYFDITDQLTISGELRHQSERILADNFVTGTHYATTFNSNLPRVNVQYKFTKDFQAYAVFSIGNNPGGFNVNVPAAALPSNVPQAYGEERLYNYEAGFKSEWLDGKLVANAAVYHLEWKNQQVLQTYLISFPGVNPVQGFTTATAASQATGAELEVNAIPAEHWDFRGTVAYGKAKYKNYCSTNYAVLTGVIDGLGCRYVNGKQQEGTPAFQTSVAVGYTQAINSGLDGFIRADYEHASKIYLDEFDYAWINPQDTLNVQIGIQTERWTIAAFGHNLTNETVGPRTTRVTDVRASGLGGGYAPINGYTMAAAGSQGAAGTARKPRQFGVHAIVNF